MKRLLLLALVALSGMATAQSVQRLEQVQVPRHAVYTETSRLNCARADVGRGVGQCTERTIVQVYNAPPKLSSAQYECSVTWELEKDANKVDFIDIVTNVTVELHGGNGRASFDTSKYIGNASDPVRSILRSKARCYPISY